MFKIIPFIFYATSHPLFPLFKCLLKLFNRYGIDDRCNFIVQTFGANVIAKTLLDVVEQPEI